MSATQRVQATSGLKSTEKSQFLLNIANRLLKLIERDLIRVEADGDIQALTALTDDELLLEVMSINSVLKGAMDEKQLKKELRRAKAKQDFYEDLKKFGGTIKAKDALVFLKATRQTVNNHIKAGKLIGIKDGSDYSIPAFQFTPTGKVEHLEEILSLMNNCSPVAQCSFFMSDMPGTKAPSETRIEVLRRSPSPTELEQIKRDAALFLVHSAS